jgi:flagellin-like protein
MFGDTDDRSKRDRGQVGIGTLIVFIAMVLVAAIAAGVLINTAGFLQSKSEAAGQQSGDQVTNRLEVSSATGAVDQTDKEITHVNVTVKQAPGADNVDLRNTSVSWVESGGTFQIVSDRVDPEATDADGRFGLGAFKDADQSSPVLNSPDDRFTMVFDLGEGTGAADFKTGSAAGPFSTTNDNDVTYSDDGSGDVVFGTNLDEGSVVTLDISTLSGAGTSERLVVPQSLSGTSAVNL